MTPAVYLVRHCEDRAASEGRLGDEGLTPRGERQARRVGAALRDVPFARCLCSPLRRARESASLILEGREVPVGVEPCLAEGSTGALEGLSIERARALHPRHFSLGATLVPRLAATDETAPGGESRAAFQARVAQAEERVRSDLERGSAPLLVVSHGGLLNYLLQRLLGVPLRDEVPFGFDHGGVAKLLQYREDPGFGPFVMARFAAPWSAGGRDP